MSNRYLSTLFKSGEEFEEFLNKLDAFKKGIEKGTIIIPEATKATQDANGSIIHSTYAKKTDIPNLANSITAKPTQKTYTLLPKAGYYYIELHDSVNAGIVIPLGVMYWSSGTEIRKQFYYNNTAYTFIILVGGGTSLKNADNTSASSKFSIYINSWQ